MPPDEAQAGAHLEHLALRGEIVRAQTDDRIGYRR
jgi:hypothetical protein